MNCSKKTRHHTDIVPVFHKGLVLEFSSIFFSNSCIPSEQMAMNKVADAEVAQNPFYVQGYVFKLLGICACM